MRLLVLTHNYPRFPGDPAGAFVARLAGAAADRGAQVRVIAPHAPGAPDREGEDREDGERGLEVTRFRAAAVTPVSGFLAADIGRLLDLPTGRV
jgi:hypothetical protein